jgi:hypothetical protein
MGACDTPDRTRSVGLKNDSKYWSVKIFFCQVRSRYNYPGYITDTGTIVGGTNIAPQSQSSIDPCVVKGAPILGTRFEGSCKAVYNGREVDHVFQNTDVPEPNYSVGGYFRIYDSSAILDDGAPELGLEWVPELDTAVPEGATKVGNG